MDRCSGRPSILARSHQSRIGIWGDHLQLGLFSYAGVAKWCATRFGNRLVFLSLKTRLSSSDRCATSHRSRLRRHRPHRSTIWQNRDRPYMALPPKLGCVWSQWLARRCALHAIQGNLPDWGRAWMQRSWCGSPSTRRHKDSPQRRHHRSSASLQSRRRSSWYVAVGPLWTTFLVVSAASRGG